MILYYYYNLIIGTKVYLIVLRVKGSVKVELGNSVSMTFFESSLFLLFRADTRFLTFKSGYSGAGNILSEFSSVI